MKYLQVSALEALSGAIADIDVGVCIFNGVVEAYSLKPVTDDKRLVKEISRAYSNEMIIRKNGNFDPLTMPMEELSRNLEEERITPLGDIQETTVQWKFAELLSTLTQSHPNRDFSNIDPHLFCVHDDLRHLYRQVNARLSMLPEIEPPITHTFWKCIDRQIQYRKSPDACEIYTYNQEAYRPGIRWEEHVFFVNRTLKQLVYVFLEGRSKIHTSLMPGQTLNARFPSSPSLGPKMCFSRNSEDDAMMEEMEDMNLLPPTVKIEDFRH